MDDKSTAFTPNATIEAFAKAASDGQIAKDALRTLDQLKENFAVAEEGTKFLNVDRKLNQAFYRGDQWWEYNPVNDQVTEPLAGDDSIHLCADNVIRPLVDTKTATVSNATPGLDVVPRTSNQGDIARATLSNRVGKVLWQQHTMSDFYQRGHKTAYIRFNCFQFYDFRPDFGKPVNSVRLDGTGNPIVNAESGRSETYWRPSGSLLIENVPPEQVHVDPRAERVVPEPTEPTDARWLFREMIVDVGEVLNNPRWKTARIDKTPAGKPVVYGGVPPVDKVTKHDSIAANDAENALRSEQGPDPRRSADGSSTYADKPAKQAKGKVVKLLLYWEHGWSNPNYPLGRFAVFMPENDWHILQYQEELPHAMPDHLLGIFGWTMIVGNHLPGRLAGVCALTDSRDGQVTINKRLTVLNELRERFVPYVVVNEESGITRESFANIGVAMLLKATGAYGAMLPTVVWPPALAQEINATLKETLHHINQIQQKLGIHDPNYYPHQQGTTWSEISSVMFRDYSNLKSVDVARAERTVYGPGLKVMIKLVQRNYSDEQLRVFFGDQGDATIQQFKQGELDDMDVTIVPGSSMEMNQALRAQMALDLFGKGVLNDPDLETMRNIRNDVLDLVGVQLNLDMTLDQLQRKWQRDENNQILMGKEPSVAWWDNNPVHMQEIVRWILTDVYSMAPEAREKALEAAWKHWTIHKEQDKKDRGIPGMDMAMAAAQPGAEGPAPMAEGTPQPGGRMMVSQEAPGISKTGSLGGPTALINALSTKISGNPGARGM